MTDTIARRAIQQDCVFQLPLPAGTLEHDLLYACPDPHNAAAELGHVGRKQEVLMFAGSIKSQPDLIEGLHPHQLTRQQVEGLSIRCL